MLEAKGCNARVAVVQDLDKRPWNMRKAIDRFGEERLAAMRSFQPSGCMDWAPKTCRSEISSR